MTAQELVSPFSLAEVAAAREAAVVAGCTLVEMLEQHCDADHRDFMTRLSLTFGYPAFSIGVLDPGSAALDLISYADAFRRRCIAIRQDDGALWVLVADPFREDTFAWASSVLDRPFRFGLLRTVELQAFLAMLETTLGAGTSTVGDNSEYAGEQEVLEEITLLNLSAETNSAVHTVNAAIYDALRLQASDIHFESDAAGINIKFRIDGVLALNNRGDGVALAEQIISRIKVLAELDIGERRIPQDGRFKVRVNGVEIDFRVSVMPSIFGEDIVLRLLDRRTVAAQASELTLEALGLDPATVRTVRRLARRAHGMLLVTGPTGSGKTTTLYAALSEINSGNDKIITIEDPVEYRLPGVLQIPVNEKKGLTFARGLRSILRHDPDKIMVGEVRDSETAEIAVQSALTGHLVFTTVHANNAFDVVGRMLQMGVDAYSLAAALNGIAAQRLLRQVCPTCAQPHVPDDDELSHCELRRSDIAEWRLMQGRGCGECRGSGYRGRKAVAEVLMLNDRLRELISMKAPVMQLRDEAAKLGFRPLRHIALELAQNGVTTLAEVSRVIF